MKKMFALVMVLALALGIFASAFSVAAATTDPVFEGTEVADLEWANGTYYGSVGNGNGKYVYTNLKIEKGQKVQFGLGGKWNLWVYPAVNGVATGEYRGGNSTKKINNGEILTFAENVTELMITAYIEGTPALTVESEEFKTMDLKFYRISTTTEEEEPSKIVDKYNREWLPGAFYNTAEPNVSVATTRRYTLLPVSEGQTVKFTLGASDWRVWVYYADANGSIGGKYVEAKNGTELKIEAIDGKVPTVLRLTAAIEKTIADEDWAKFDLKIDVADPPITDKAGRVWEKGAFYDTVSPNTSLATTRRYTVVSCKEGDTVTFTMVDEKCRLWVYPADANGSIGGKYFEAKNGMEYKIEAIDGRVPTALRVTVTPSPDSVISDAMWPNFGLAIKVTAANPPTDDVVLTSSVIGMFIALAVGTGAVALRNKKENI